jgi:hypothetical protein
MAVQPQQVSWSWRRCLRFSTRALIATVLLIGAVVGWLVRSARIQREAVEAILKAGGKVQYDWEWWHGKELKQGRPWGPRWLVKLIGVDYFGHVTNVSLLGYSPEADEAVVRVSRLPGLQRLALLGPSFDDADLARVEVLTDLESLTILSDQVTDAGAAHLRGLTKLTYLSIEETKISDAGLEHLSGLTNIRILSLRDSQVAGPGFGNLQSLAQLASLNLGGCPIPDTGLTHLTSLTNLRLLCAYRTPVTRAGRNALMRAMPNLEEVLVE